MTVGRQSKVSGVKGDVWGGEGETLGESRVVWIEHFITWIGNFNQLGSILVFHFWWMSQFGTHITNLLGQFVAEMYGRNDVFGVNGEQNHVIFDGSCYPIGGVVGIGELKLTEDKWTNLFEQRNR